MKSDSTVTWTRMEDGTKADYQELGRLYDDHAHGELVENLLSLLNVMKGPKLGYQVDRYIHSLQSASRAMRADESPDLVVGALLHDIGDPIAPDNHSALAASIIKPYVDDETHWIVQHHGLFQGYYYFHHLGGNRDGREIHADHEHYDACVNFCANYDQNCFDPDYDTLPMDAFLPVLEEVVSRESRVPGLAPMAMTTDIHVN